MPALSMPRSKHWKPPAFRSPRSSSCTPMIGSLRENEDRSRKEVLRDLEPAQRAAGLMPELVGVKTYQADEFNKKVDWMMKRGFLAEAPNYGEVVRSKASEPAK